MKNRSYGYTLTELMLSLALLAILVGIGVPSFRDFSRNGRMVTIANDFLGGIQTARTEAIKRQLPSGGVAICPSQEPEADEPECLGEDATNFDGWIVFLDEDNNCDRGADEQILRIGERIDLNNSPARYVSSVSNGNCISFGATGFLRTDTGRESATRTLFCDERGNQKQPGFELSVARGLDVTTTGRARITRDVDEIANWTVQCP
jgi:type IV fimbrial biogenesis protein FimT